MFGSKKPIKFRLTNGRIDSHVAVPLL